MAERAPIDSALEAGFLPAGEDLPRDLDPLAEGVLMAHQRAWLEDGARLKIAEKCRRSGFTFAEALDDTLTAATARAEGGMNVFYIGDTKEKGREFIGYCAHFARVVANDLARVEEFVFADRRADGSTQDISAFRIAFASGNSIVALSSRPESVRGLQGVVVIDEAAFHRDIGKMIDAAVALLIWGGRIRIISTHDGRLNPFNDLVTRTRAGKTNYSLHRITFDEVIENGLYERAVMMRPELPPKAEWESSIRRAYTDEAAMREELDVIPRDAEGAALSRVQVEACADPRAPVLRIARPEAFATAPEGARRREIGDWIARELAPVLARIDVNRRTVIGADVARRGHASSFWIAQIGPGLKRECVAVVEPRRLPFDQLRQILFFIFDHSGRRWTAQIDSSGLGMETAEAAVLKYGSRVEAVTFSAGWYRDNGSALVTSVEDRSMTVPQDDDVISDLCALAYVGGVVRIPENHETVGADGGKRHADAGIAAMLMEAAARVEPPAIDFQSAGARLPGMEGYAEGPEFEAARAGGGAGWGTVAGGVSFEGWDNG